MNKINFFHDRIKNQIDVILGETYLLKKVISSFEDFSHALSALINPDIGFEEGQIADYDMQNKFDIYDKYFEVVRVSDMSTGQFIQQYLDTSAELISEFQHTSMSRGEIAYMLKAWEAANLILLENESIDTIEYIAKSTGEFAPTANEERALYRWKLAHHGFALFLIFSGYCFKKAIALIQKGDYSEKLADWIDKGAHLFRATTACMEFGNSFTATIYRGVVRPDMSKANEEANLPNGFSGTQNYEYVQWRKLKLELLALIKDNKNELPIHVMDAIELFRAYYLEDMHIHSIIAGRMVGIEKSLLQDGIHKKKANPMKITAADMLRMMAKAREKECEFILSNN
jgi:uncharacterized protein (DUF1330 family)